jgi:hypothetical protein
LNSAGHALELGVAHLDEVVLDGVDRLGDRLQLTQDLAFADAEQSVENRRHVRALLGCKQSLWGSGATLPSG